jgi:hypothetical protein
MIPEESFLPRLDSASSSQMALRTQSSLSSLRTNWNQAREASAHEVTFNSNIQSRVMHPYAEHVFHHLELSLGSRVLIQTPSLPLPTLCKLKTPKLPVEQFVEIERNYPNELKNENLDTSKNYTL